jgi:hypothetical protein
VTGGEHALVRERERKPAGRKGTQEREWQRERGKKESPSGFNGIGTGIREDGSEGDSP